MNFMHENLAGAQMTARPGEAQELRQGRELTLVRRQHRSAEHAAPQARLAIARSF